MKSYLVEYKLLPLAHSYNCLLSRVSLILENMYFKVKCSVKHSPHKVKLELGMRQNEPELINAINELCIGNPSLRSIEYLWKLQRPIPHTDDTVFIFGTNFDVDFFNHQKLEQLPGAMSVFNSKDKGPPKYLILSNAPKALAVKIGCKVIVTQKLANGLVNGLTATVLRIEDEKLTIQVDVYENLPHGMECKIFEIEKYCFTVL